MNKEFQEFIKRLGWTLNWDELSTTEKQSIEAVWCQGWLAGRDEMSRERCEALMELNIGCPQ